MTGIAAIKVHYSGASDQLNLRSGRLLAAIPVRETTGRNISNFIQVVH